MDDLLPLAARIGQRLMARGETVAIAESSSGGLIAASLLAVPGASAFFVGGGVIYTGTARSALLGFTPEDMAGLRPSTEAYAARLAEVARRKLGAAWALGETGAAGPSGNRYGNPAGHCAFAVSGPLGRTGTIETGSADRWANMRAFAAATLTLFAETLAAA